MISQLYKKLILRPREDYPIILTCVFIASCIWLLNALNKEYNTEIRYPVKFVYDAQRIIPVSELPEKLELNVSGKGWDLLKRTLNLNLKPVSISTARAAGKSFLSSADLLPFFIKQMPELKVNYVVSDSVLVYMNRLVSKKVAIKLDINKLKIEDNLILKEAIKIEPDSIEISGANTLVEQFPNFVYINLPITKLKADFNEVVPIDVKQYNFIKFKTKNVKVRILTTALKSLSFNLAVEKINGFPLNDSIVKVNLFFDAQLADSLKIIDTSAIKVKAIPSIKQSNAFKFYLENTPKEIIKYTIEPELSTPLGDEN